MASQGQSSFVSQGSELPSPAVATQAAALSWTVHLMRRNVAALPALIAAIGGGGLLVTLVFHSALPGIAAILLLTGSVREYLFPVRYRVTERVVEVRCPGSRLELAWEDVRRLIIEDHQVTLSPLAAPSRLDAFRGVTLRFGIKGAPGDRESVMEACRKFALNLCSDMPASADLCRL